MTDLFVRPEAPLPSDLAKPDRVHRRIYLDEAVFEAEMDKIFSRTWIYVGHESEVEHPGDYKTTFLGRQPVIVSRDEAGAIHVLLNRCTHRAATVCQAASGNSNFFRCEYHGWMFRNNGELVAPTFGGGYDPADFDIADFTLGRAPRVDTHRGLIFASLAEHGPSLREHLGLAADYIDLAVDIAPEGRIRLGAGTHKYRYPGNWKLQSENGVDGYHPNFVHRAFFDTSGGDAALAIFGARSQGRAGTLGRGHGILDSRPMMAPLIEMGMNTPQGAEALDRLTERLGDRDRAREVMRSGGTQGFNLLVFPNLQMIGYQIRVIHPRTVLETDVELYPYLLEGASEETNAARLRGHESFYGPAGGGGPDDVEMFARVFEGLKVTGVEWLPMVRGLRREVVEGEARWGHVTDEQPQRGFYQRWLECMEAE